MRGKRNEPTVEAAEADYWYAAGFIDGEGCITVRESGQTSNHKSRLKGWNPSWYASVTISQAVPHDWVLRWHQERWGGSIRRKPEGKYNARESYEWLVVGQQAYRLLEGVLPMLKVKEGQARNALRLRDLRSGRGVGLTPDQITERQAIRTEALRLNRRGLPEV
jgi:hypothetical protein